jgi:hypothetical protein
VDRTELTLWENRQQTSHLESVFLKVPLPSVAETFVAETFLSQTATPVRSGSKCR